MRSQSPWNARLPDGTGSSAERLADVLGSDILHGILSVGDRLPAHRDLAWRLGIGIGSVTRAYAILERRGLVRAEHGRGSFVAARADDRSILLDMSTNMPPPMFSDRALARTLSRLARTVDASLFNVYPPVAGHIEHRRIMAHWLTGCGIEIDPENLLLTGGAQQALSVAFTVARPHVRSVITEEVTYPGMLDTVRRGGRALKSVAMDAQGMMPDGLEAALSSPRTGRALVYVTPTLHNPTTACMDSDRVHAIAQLCRRFDALVIEDGVYAGQSKLNHTLAALIPERTFHVSSLSKIISPGLRIGALAPPAAFAAQTLPVLLASSLMIAPLSYAMMAQWLSDGTASSVRQSLRAEAARRRNLARNILGKRMTEPGGDGFHLWLPMDASTAENVAANAKAIGVSIAPPSAFASCDTLQTTGVRLALGAVSFKNLIVALTRIRQACELVERKVSRDTIVVG